jgi:predicted transcriptional regulator
LSSFKAETESFVSRFGAGAIEPMLAAFVEDRTLSAEKIARLKQILDEKEAGNEREK